MISLLLISLALSFSPGVDAGARSTLPADPAAVVAPADQPVAAPPAPPPGEVLAQSQAGVAVVPPGTEVVSPQPAWMNAASYWLIAVIIFALSAASLTSALMSRRDMVATDDPLMRRFRTKLRVWWVMTAILMIGFLFHYVGTVILFGLVSFWALREFITMTPTRRGDHRTLFWVFFIFLPMQYLLVLLGNSSPEWLFGRSDIDFYGLYSIFIPVYASLFIPARIALSGDSKRFLERSAIIQAGLLICVYSLSYAPALLELKLMKTDGTVWGGRNVSLLLFMLLIAQLAALFERLWSRWGGRHLLAARINGSRTWEGLFGSMVTTGFIAAALYWATPFMPWEAGVMGAIVAMMAIAGTLTMSAIKRDRGVNDTGTLVQGHAGLLDQIDNVCFAAPVFYHLTRFFYT